MQISWWTLAIQGVNFVVLVWLLRRFLYGPIQDVIERRRRLNEQALNDAERARQAAEDRSRNLDAARAGLAAERQSVLDEARSAIEAERTRILDQARLEAADHLAKAAAALGKDRAEAVAATRAEATDLAVRLARTLLVDLARSIPGDAILARLESELAGLPPAERRRLDEEIAANGASVDIVTARALEPEDRRRWEIQLEKVLAHRLQLRFEQDPDLVAGAVLRLPHTVVRATWADQLERARSALLEAGDGTAS